MVLVLNGANSFAGTPLVTLGTALVLCLLMHSMSHSESNT